MPPETTFQTTLGEVARAVERIDRGQVALITRFDAQQRDLVTRREWEMHQASWTAFRQRVDAEATSRRVPWTAVAALVVAALGLASTLGMIG